jgi:hypothetical protein
MLANYLIYEKHLPLLGLKGKWFYFTNNSELKVILSNLPFWLKVVKKF